MEVIVKVNDGASYKDGDVVDVKCLDSINFAHAENICNPRNFGFNTSGMRDRNTLLEKFLAATRTYKFERVNANDVRRTNLITGQQDILNKTANSDDEKINAALFISRRLRNANHKIFGTDGSEVWYGKLRTNALSDFILPVWNIIESETDYLRSDHSMWSFTDIEKRHFVCINMSGRSYTGDSFTRVELSGGTVYSRRSSAVEEQSENSEESKPIVLAKRQWFVPYWDLATELGETVDDLRNANIVCDCRKPMDEREHIDILTYDKITEGLI